MKENVLTPANVQGIHDRAGRVTRERFISAGVERYVTSTTYGGDFVTVDPPDGQTPTTAWTDAVANLLRGRLSHAGATT